MRRFVAMVPCPSVSLADEQLLRFSTCSQGAGAFRGVIFGTRFAIDTLVENLGFWTRLATVSGVAAPVHMAKHLFDLGWTDQDSPRVLETTAQA